MEAPGIGIALGLVLGKPIGITMFSVLGVRMKILALPGDLKRKHISSVSVLGGVGFTMSIFITLLAFQDAALVQESKIAILISSLFAGLLGCLVGLVKLVNRMSVWEAVGWLADKFPSDLKKSLNESAE